MAENLPDEIISEILSPALKVPEATFSDTTSPSPFAASRSVSSSVTLLVCKAWLRVATPLLYHVVVIRSKAQARALQAALRGNPDLGRFIRMLRLEGGFGPAIHQILKGTPNVTDIVISLQIYASDSTAGLVLGLPHINPTRLILLEESPLHNKHAMALVNSISKCAETWTNLTTISFPYLCSTSGERQEFVAALCAIPTVKRLSFLALSPTCGIDAVQSLAQNSALEGIELLVRPEKGSIRSISADERLVALLHWPEKRKKKSASKSTLCTPTDPAFQPMASCPQAVVNYIWSRILFFAMLPRETMDSAQDKHYLRLRFLLVSKLFQRLALPYLYRYLTFPRESSLHRLAARLASAPAVGAHIHVMQILSYPFDRNVGNPAVDLTRLFP
ncbi:hypothetical protein DFH09DRAFT_973379, partial [Mycena vulgaris]